MTKYSAPVDHGYSRTAARTIAMMLILIVAGKVAHDAATVARSTSACNSATESLESVTHFVSPVSEYVDFPTFSGHTITLTNSPGRLELFATERTK